MFASIPSTPEYVDRNLVVDFDIYSDPDMKIELHGGMKKLHSSAPDIFYTPRNGGHWVVTRYEVMTEILKDTEHFSNKELVIPKSHSPHVMIPLNLDPPDHAPFRLILMKEFGQKAIKDMEPKLREKARQLIEAVKPQGGCDFTETLGAGFPVSVFMDLMGMPVSRFDEFRSIVSEYFGGVSIERRHELESIIFAINAELISERRMRPQNDMVSRLITSEADGRPLTQEELLSMMFVLFLGGLDTVANALTFAFRHLAMDSPLRKKLRENLDLIPAFVEESLRRYAVVNQTRVVKKDIQINGANFTAGDMVLCILALAGMDERTNPSPMDFDVEREDRKHITFSTGAHTCIGNVLARNEMRIFTEEWLKAIPDFFIPESTVLDWRPGLVMSLPSLPLRWSQ